MHFSATRDARDDAEAMHFGEEESWNDFAGEPVGLVNGCIDPGDDYVLNLLAEADLDAQPEREPCGKCDGDGCPGDPDCRDGERRAHGREFVGRDADTAQAIPASVRENHVAQAAGRYARNADDPTDKATVFVRTDALPSGFADLQVPGVEWAPTDIQREILETLQGQGKATAREVSKLTGTSKRHVSATLARLVDADAIALRERAGPHGATVYRADSTLTTGVVDIGVDEIANEPLWESYTWSFTISAPFASTAPNGARLPPMGSDDSTANPAVTDDPPPD